MPASASAGLLRSRSVKRLARPLALQVFFQVAVTFNWRDAGLGIRGTSSVQIGETAREAARPPVIFSGWRNFQLEGCRPRHPRGFFDPDRRNGSRGRWPSNTITNPRSPRRHRVPRRSSRAARVARRCGSFSNSTDCPWIWPRAPRSSPCRKSVGSPAGAGRACI